ncbi:EAL domain-containing protein [Dechloromonas sp. XY25]|uniref:EAL domain-containing protein n=1 Tax=Dechloromonas hankyongensis TaxID=2908002 RepID=A0ABS9K4I5_9RHOO|nr:EAL domain-containing protein [Dechloromonas hankyongensis]MCG2578055.1 EAL domain-containing protein [Dechloromonas hankyongensis]
MLGMEVAFISEFKDGRRVFRYVDSQEGAVPLCVGASDPLEESYCQRVTDGRLPELICDATQNPEALTLPVTTALPVGAHLSVPIRFADGQIYGTFCCFSTYPDSTFNERDIRAMRLFAEVAGKLLERQVSEDEVRNELVTRLRAVLDGERFTMVYQPIIHVAQNKIVGYEALTRFSAEPVRTPDQWFNEAAVVGLQEELELAVIKKALQGLARLPPDAYLSLNVSPETLLKGSVASVLEGYPFERLILEVTEHASVSDYSPIAAILEPMRRRGLRLAVDDAGAGFASFRHILKLQPDVIKLDVSLIRKIDTDTGCRALAAALIRFAEETGSKIVAEGVETDAELQALRELKVNKAQGYLLGRPLPIEALCV